MVFPWRIPNAYKVGVFFQLFISTGNPVSIKFKVAARQMQRGTKEMTPPEESSNGKNIILFKDPWMIEYKVGESVIILTLRDLRCCCFHFIS
jgi:hypothetical protein